MKIRPNSIHIILKQNFDLPRKKNKLNAIKLAIKLTISDHTEDRKIFVEIRTHYITNYVAYVLVQRLYDLKLQLKFIS